MYYDPLLDVHHKLPVFVAVINALYLAPQRPEDARRLYDAGLTMLGALGAGPANVIGERLTGVSLLLAKEWGDDATATRLQAAAEATYQPSWDPARGEFTWGFGLGEEHPRGQFNAIMAAAEVVTPGGWTALATGSPAAGPPGEVVGVDFPTVACSRAEWVDGALHLATVPMNDDVVGRPTSWRIVGLDDPARWSVSGAEATVEGGDLVVSTSVGRHHYVVSPGA